MNIDTLRQDGKVLKQFPEDDKTVLKIKSAISKELEQECDEVF